jgi:hypothetical protein
MKGGIYLDIKFECINEFKFAALVDKEYVVLERKEGWDNELKGIYNGFMICKPYNRLLYIMIKKVCYNVNNNYYGSSALYPTGPLFYGGMYEKYIGKLTELCELKFADDGLNILYNNIPILKTYNKYRDEQKLYQRTDHYSKMWEERRIYLKK